VRRGAREGEQYFRRGLVMGLTLAEIMILVLFALLLLLGWRVQAGAAEGQAAERLATLMNAAGLTSSGGNDFDENFKRLTLMTTTGKDVLASLHDPDAPETPAKEALADVPALLKLGHSAERVLGRNTMNETNAQAAEQFIQRIDDLYGTSRAGSAPIWLDGLLQCAKGCGPGGDLPPCARTAAGKPALVFDAVLNSDSIVLRETVIPELTASRAQWPTQAIQFGSALAPAAFLSQTQPLFAWSEQRMCRFFVNVIDATGAGEKLIYKTRLRTVEAHFYKHESFGPDAPR
jgi:hypothetical protein